MYTIHDTHASYLLSATPSADDIIAMASNILAGRLRFGEALTDPSAAGKYMQLKIGASEREVFFVLFLDNRHRVIHEEVMFLGTIDASEVHPREVAKTALLHNAAAIMCAHNHPSGVNTPSTADCAITRKLRDALSLVDIRTLDHFVVSRSGFTSMAERGLF